MPDYESVQSNATAAGTARRASPPDYERAPPGGKSAAAAAHPGASIYADGTVVGTVTSAAYGYRVQKNLAMGFVEPSAGGRALEGDVLDQRASARVLPEPPFDPGHSIMRS